MSLGKNHHSHQVNSTIRRLYRVHIAKIPIIFSNTKKRQTDSLAYSDKFLIFAKVKYKTEQS